MRLHAINNIDNADDSSELELSRKTDPVFLLNCREVF
jgi:hypothetical protein